MTLRALAILLVLGTGVAGIAEAKKPKPVNHRVSTPKVKPRKVKNPRLKKPKVKRPKHRG